jgi:hypothetical protein
LYPKRSAPVVSRVAYSNNELAHKENKEEDFSRNQKTIHKGELDEHFMYCIESNKIVFVHQMEQMKMSPLDLTQGALFLIKSMVVISKN